MLKNCTQQQEYNHSLLNEFTAKLSPQQLKAFSFVTDAIANRKSCLIQWFKTIALSNQKYNYYIVFIPLSLDFEFDEKKSHSNKQKHGIDFREAQSLWSDSNLIEISARTEDEPQFLLIGKIADKCWSAVITYRGEKVRIISVRRAQTEEVAIYEGTRV